MGRNVLYFNLTRKITLRIQILISFNNVLNYNVPATVTVTVYLVFLLSRDL